jgi:hypothetical protein
VEKEISQIVTYQPEEGISSLEVRLENDTVWLTQNQMAELFQTDRTSIVKHIGNVYKSFELEEISTCAKIAQVQLEGKRKVKREMIYYNLDVILSVGYRVNSKRGTHDGQIFDAYNLAVSIIKTADKSIILIDNYVDETVLTMLSKRKDSVETIIYTANISKQLELDLKKHNAQYKPVEVRLFKKSHDRFMIIDEEHLYHIGASLKDLGKKMFAFSKISIDPRLILKNLK